MDCAVKLPRSNSSEISGSRNVMPTAQPATATSATRAMVLSIKRNAWRNWKRLRKRAISGSSELDTGVIKYASGTVRQRML